MGISEDGIGKQPSNLTELPSVVFESVIVENIKVMDK